ncbi:MAG: HIT domain-containing protein [Candidatus Omnitrophica bacterium]|nr:HIT domain-containing protein [Candidatus Omnitrophota bacterium]
MDKLWAPWRKKVIYRTQKGCIFCAKPRQKKDAKNFLFMRRSHSFAMLNLYPYNNGHVMVAPYRHVKRLEDLTKEEASALVLHVQECEALLRKLLRPAGFNIGLNEGRIAGAGFKDHIHVHIVPRWGGDTNYMPVLSETKVISESLEAMYRQLTNAHTR